jgi:hypothetical protein
MATDVQGTTARRYHTQQTHYLRKRVSFDDASLGGIVGILPANAIILRGNVYVFTAFNAGTLDVGAQGTSANTFASALALAQAIVPFDDLAIGNARRAADTTVTFARSATATAGEAEIIVEYVVKN